MSFRRQVKKWLDVQLRREVDAARELLQVERVDPLRGVVEHRLQVCEAESKRRAKKEK